MDATQLKMQEMSDSNLNDRSAADFQAREKFVSKVSYADVPEREDLDDFDDEYVDNCDEDTQGSPEIRQRKGENRALTSMEDGKLGTKTINIK